MIGSLGFCSTVIWIKRNETLLWKNSDLDLAECLSRPTYLCVYFNKLLFRFAWQTRKNYVYFRNAMKIVRFRCTSSVQTFTAGLSSGSIFCVVPYEVPSTFWIAPFSFIGVFFPSVQSGYIMYTHAWILRGGGEGAIVFSGNLCISSLE